MRVKPSLLTGILVLLGYLVVVFTVWIIAGVDYDEVGDTVDNVRNVIAVSMIVGAVYIAVVTSVLGWWKPALREPRRAAHHTWMWVIPIVLALGVIGNLATTKWGEIDQLGTYVMWLTIGCIGVGFNEEMITRGLLIVGARGTLHEGWVWFVSSLCFGLLHVPNAFFGQSVKDTVQQVFFAFGIGTAYYVTRRISGVLIIAMVLHGTWDFSTFIQTHSVDLLDDKPVALGGIVMIPVVLVSLIAVWRLHHDEGDVVEPGGDQLAAFETAA